MLTVVVPNYRVFVPNDLSQVFQAWIKSIGATGMLWAVPTRRGVNVSQGWVAGRRRLEFDAFHAATNGDSMSHFIISPH